MSLNATAQHLAAHGRGPDTTLVHMSRGEVKSLQDLALAHGGSLSINPQTGLPEAGFLSSLLPMIGGAALSAMGMPPMMASLVMGGVTGVASGSLSKGLMAGLGAYGGAGMMGGLMGAGTNAMTTAGLGDYAGTLAGQGLQAGTPEYGAAASKLALEAQNQAMAAPFMDKAKAGFSQIGEAPGQFFKDNWKYAAAAAAPVLAAPQTATKQPEIKTDTDPGKMAREGYQFDPGHVDTAYDSNPFGPERTYFKPRYFKPAYAGGGSIEAMSEANAIGANTGYPMADISKGAYATPYQTPISRNVLSGAADTGVNPMTGEMAFDEGGIVPSTTGQGGKFEYDPLTQMFKKIEAMPSDNQVQTNKPAEPLPTGNGGTNPQQAQINSYFNSLSPEGLAAHQQNQANVINAIMPGAGIVKALKSMTEGGEGSKISPLAVPSLAMSKVGDALSNGLGYLAFKMSKPNPNPDAVQVVDAGDMLKSESTLGDTQAKADANNAQQAQAISAALSALHGVGPSGSGTSAGFGAPGATSGNAGAMGFGPAGMASQSVGGIGAGGATGGGATGGGGGGGAPGAPGLGVSSGGGYGISASMGGTAGVGGTAGAAAGAARGGLMAAYSNGGSHLGDYSDGGRLLKGPGDGVSDSIPAMIGKKQPARLADGEFVVPARIVSELGNGSTEAGARKLYAMMDRVQKARGKTVGKGRVAKNSRADKYLPA
jgi:hypothetical protein